VPIGVLESETALAELLILSELRDLDELVAEQATKMQILNDIVDHKVLGREYKKGELVVLRRQIEKRFGGIPAWVEERLAGLSARELEDLRVRVLDATSLEDLLR
jgi:phage terminase Nu1 subunit (DNA packaging protein)